jgi:hypothetical protein
MRTADIVIILSRRNIHINTEAHTYTYIYIYITLPNVFDVVTELLACRIFSSKVYLLLLGTTALSLMATPFQWRLIAILFPSAAHMSHDVDPDGKGLLHPEETGGDPGLIYMKTQARTKSRSATNSTKNAMYSYDTNRTKDDHAPLLRRWKDSKESDESLPVHEDVGGMGNANGNGNGTVSVGSGSLPDSLSSGSDGKGGLLDIEAGGRRRLSSRKGGGDRR